MRNQIEKFLEHKTILFPLKLKYTGTLLPNQNPRFIFFEHTVFVLIPGFLCVLG